MAWKTLEDMDLQGKRVLVRVDLNVPVDEAGQITDTTRIDRMVPTVRDILRSGGRPILVSHFGRPKGKVVMDLSLRFVLPALERAIGAKVAFAETLEGAAARTAEAEAAQVLLLENIRFHPGEETNDPALADRLAGLADVYCNDAFSAAHRAHASTEAVAHRLPCCAGRLMQAELEALEAALDTPARPVGAVVGGAKVSTKIDLLMNLVNRIDVLIIGGGMANTFLAAQGADLGTSLQEPDLHETARTILAHAAETGCTILLPSDGCVTTKFAAGVPFDVVPLDADTRLDDDQMVLDAGPAATKAILSAFSDLRTLIWNGPLGAFEIAPFDTATVTAAREAARLTTAGRLLTVAGGGDTVAALNQAGVVGEFTYVSTAGGAFLEWMEGKTLPGVAALGG